MQTKSYSIESLKEILENAGCEVKEWNGKRLYITSTPNGGKGDYGYLVHGDSGATGTCAGISRRKGEIAAIIREGK